VKQGCISNVVFSSSRAQRKDVKLNKIGLGFLIVGNNLTILSFIMKSEPTYTLF
jgi:hypothetical protein